MAGYLNFTCGGMEFVVPSTDLRGVLEGPQIVRVPLAPASVAGIFNWKGRIETALDPAAFRGGPPCAAPRYALVLDYPEVDVAVVAETVGNVFHVEGDGGIEAGNDPLPPVSAAVFGAGRTMVVVKAFVEAVKAEAGGRGACEPGA